MDIGFKNADKKPVIFEKSLKLLATLGQLPTFTELMVTYFDSAEAKLKKYASKLYEILSGGPTKVTQTLISVICEQVEKLLSSENPMVT